MNNYIDQFLAFMAGDTDATKAYKSQRQLDSALKTQISNMEGQLITKEDAVSFAEEKFKKQRVNYGVIMTADSERAEYVKKLIEAQQELEDAKEALEQHKKTYEFLKEQLEFIRTVPVAEIVADSSAS